jgi:hypothetical protein
MKRSYLILLLVTALGAFAQASEESEVLDAAMNDLKPAISYLDRSIYVFHYARLSEDPKKVFSNQDPEVKDHFQNWVNYFWDRSQDETIKGYVHGYYAALNPVKTRSYGGEGPAMFLNRVELTRQIRVLDLLKTHGDVSQIVLTYLQSRGCTSSVPGTMIYQNILQKFGGKACRDFQLALLERAQVDVIRYGYSYDEIKDCLVGHAREMSDEAAFIILKTDHIPAQSVRTYNGLADQDDLDQGAERTILQTILSENWASHPRLAISSSKARASAEEVRAYKAAHLLTCRNLQTAP